MRTAQELTAHQLDALVEITNIGAAHAATALSKMADSAIEISIPELLVTRLSEVAETLRKDEEPLAATAAQIHGDLAGHIVFVLSMSGATQLCDILLCREPGSSSLESETAQSTLKELGNILGAGFMNALADFLRMELFPSVPTLVIDPPTGFAKGLGLRPESAFVLYIRTKFRFLLTPGGESHPETPDDLAGVLLFLPTEKSLHDIFSAIKVLP